MAPNLFIYRFFYEIEFATILFLPYVFFVCLFGKVCAGICCEACGNLVPQPGIKPTPYTLEGKVVTTGPPGKSWVPSLD